MSTLCVRNFTTFFVFFLMALALLAVFYLFCFFGMLAHERFLLAECTHHTYIHTINCQTYIYIYKKLHAAIGSMALSLSLDSLH